MRWFSWEPGRQGGGYFKMLLATSPFPLGWDLYLIKFPSGSYISDHQDPVKDGRHHRLNITLWRPMKGGDFLCEPEGLVLTFGRVVLFRPDVATHSVTEITEGWRLVLSCGFVLPR